VIVHPVELASVRHTLVVWKGQQGGLQAISLGGYETRHEALLDVLEETDVRHCVGPFRPVVIHTDDQPVSGAADGWQSYAFCTAQGYVDVAVPDFVFGGWPEVGIDDFDETCRTISAAGEEPADVPVVGWIGTVGTNPVRAVLRRLAREHPNVLDVHEIEWIREGSGTRLQTSVGKVMTLAEQAARWEALVDVEGVGYSGRLKLLLHSGRPVLVQDRPWREWYWDELVPMEHYIPVKRNLSDLVDRARWVQDHRREALRIGQAGQDLARRFLTRTNAVEQWARTLAHPQTTAPRGWTSPALQDALSPVLRRLGAALPAD